MSLSTTTATTHMNRPATWFAATLTLLLGGAASAEPVTVKLESGREFTADVDEQTDDTALVLRFEGATTVLWRPIAWDRVVRVHQLGETWSADEFRAVVGKFATARNRTLRQPVAKSASTIAQPGATTTENRVRALHIEARIANWDADASPDGLLVSVTPLDAIGNAVAVDGTISVDLIAARPAALRSRYVYQRGAPVETIGRWTRTVRRDDFSGGRAELRLPFEAIDPESAYQFDSLAQVQASFAAPGNGVFSATADLVRIRRFSPTRDAERQSGRSVGQSLRD